MWQTARWGLRRPSQSARSRRDQRTERGRDLRLIARLRRNADHQVIETLVRIFESDTILVQEHEPARERRPLVPIDEWLILGEVEDVRRREVEQIAFIDVRGHALRGMDRRLEKSPIAQTAITTVPV